MCPVTSVDQYLEVLRTCRIGQPFTVVHDPLIILDYRLMFDQSEVFLTKPTNFHIRSYLRMKFVNGVCSASDTYMNTSQPFQFITRNSSQVQLNEVRPKEPGLTKFKADDVLSVLPLVRNKAHAKFLRKLCTSWAKK